MQEQWGQGFLSLPLKVCAEWDILHQEEDPQPLAWSPERESFSWPHTARQCHSCRPQPPPLSLCLFSQNRVAGHKGGQKGACLECSRNVGSQVFFALWARLGLGRGHPGLGPAVHLAGSERSRWGLWGWVTMLLFAVCLLCRVPCPVQGLALLSSPLKKTLPLVPVCRLECAQ